MGGVVLCSRTVRRAGAVLAYFYGIQAERQDRLWGVCTTGTSITSVYMPCMPGVKTLSLAA
jgi:hypothetical protein